jgi:hypothetical protein
MAALNCTITGHRVLEVRWQIGFAFIDDTYYAHVKMTFSFWFEFLLSRRSPVVSGYARLLRFGGIPRNKILYHRGVSVNNCYFFYFIYHYYYYYCFFFFFYTNYVRLRSVLWSRPCRYRIRQDISSSGRRRMIYTPRPRLRHTGRDDTVTADA